MLSYIQINQVNGDAKWRGRQPLIQKLNATAKDIYGHAGPQLNNLYERIVGMKCIYLKSEVTRPIEYCHQMWTTYGNLKLWFDTWEQSLESLGFGKRKEISLEEQPKRIINIDETFLSLDVKSG